ncbi:hypothetical protein C1T30_43155, partial [Bacillus sp. MBGLi97]
ASFYSVTPFVTSQEMWLKFISSTVVTFIISAMLVSVSDMLCVISYVVSEVLKKFVMLNVSSISDS